MASKTRKYEKYCCYGTCKNKSSVCTTNGVTFIPFPKPTTLLATQRALIWVDACRRESVTLTTINKQKYVCSEHFVGGKGPTDQNPNPIPATCEVVPSRRVAISKRPNLETNGLGCSHVKVIKVVVNENDIPPEMRLASSQTDNCYTVDNSTQTEMSPILSPTTSSISYNLYQEVMKNFPTWAMNCVFGSDTFTANMMKIVNHELAVTVTARYCYGSFAVSVDICKYQLQKMHPFWVNHERATNLLGVITVLRDLDSWNICVKLARTPYAERKSTTTCKLLCPVPSVLCPVCATAARDAALCGKVTAGSLMNTTHLNMSTSMLGQKLKVMKKSLRNIKSQNKRLKVRIEKFENEATVECEMQGMCGVEDDVVRVYCSERCFRQADG